MEPLIVSSAFIAALVLVFICGYAEEKHIGSVFFLCLLLLFTGILTGAVIISASKLKECESSLSRDQKCVMIAVPENQGEDKQ